MHVVVSELIAVSLLVFGVLVVKNAFVAFATWLRVRFIWGKLFSVSSRLFERYLSQPYEYFLTRNSAVLSKNFLVDINHVVGDIIRPAMVILSEGMVALFIAVFLFWYDAPLAATVVAIFGGGYPLIYWATRSTLARIGRERLVAHEQRFRMAHEALDALVHYRWPGNVRELSNFVERLVVFSDEDTLTVREVEAELSRQPRRRPTSPAPANDGATLGDRRDDAERQAIREALDRAGGNRTQAARLLGISRRTLYNKLAEMDDVQPRS